MKCVVPGITQGTSLEIPRREEGVGGGGWGVSKENPFRGKNEAELELPGGIGGGGAGEVRGPCWKISPRE